MKNRARQRLCFHSALCTLHSALPFSVLIFVISVAAPQTRAAWFDAAWQYRRPIDVTWDAEHASGDELATLEFYSNGHALPNADDVRVATDDGNLVPSHILMNGPGDRIRVLFSLQKNIKKYAVYFGNPNPKPPPAGFDDVKYKAGLMIQTKVWTGGAVNNFQQVEKSWERSGPVLGEGMIDRPFLGYNLFGDQQQWISKIVGSLFAPEDGEYIFAMSVDDEGALYIDGKPLLFAHLGPGDIRYHASIQLLRGRHDFMLYHVNAGADGRFTVGWKTPSSPRVDVIGRESFGTCFGSVVGVMEERGKVLVADYSVAQLGECFYSDRYSFRYHFTGQAKAEAAIKYDWDFGDGQTSHQADVDHVYLTDGIYPVRLTAHIGPNSDTQTSKIVVGRNYEKILNPAEEDPAALSKVVAAYDVDAIPASDLPRAVMLHLRANRLEAATTVANRLAAQPKHPDPAPAIEALLAIDYALIEHGQLSTAVAMWDRVPADANIQPRAVKRAAQLALWWTGDFDKAVKLLTPFKDRDDASVRRPYAQALILSGKVDDGKKILTELPMQGPADRQAALSGASARTVEFFITEREAEAGDEAWDRWQAKYPADFLEGYSVLLRTKLIELCNEPQAAAAVAQAFATAMPQSSYAPQLLDRASKLLAKTDPAKSAALRQLLKQKYPEDPLAQ
jgi:PKD repeat protein